MACVRYLKSMKKKSELKPKQVEKRPTTLQLMRTKQLKISLVQGYFLIKHEPNN